METYCLIFCCRACWADIISSFVLLEFISKAKDAEDLAEQGDQDEIEHQEDPEVIDNILDHHNNWGQCWENSQEEECLGNQQKHNHNHEHFAYNVEWSQP